MNKHLRQLPSVDALLRTESARALIERFSRVAVADGVRQQLQQVRQQLLAGSKNPPPFSHGSFFDEIARQLQVQWQNNLRRVINATGIVIHTNLGRAPLAAVALEAIKEVALGYSNLEFDVNSGQRGSRYAHVEQLTTQLTGAQAMLVVNNNAGAILLALSTLAKGAEVVISRGELVEIGGSFRIPDVIAQSGARLLEVGTTNKTRLADYEAAITPQTRVILKVHPSNYRITGFTSAVAATELVALARQHHILVVEDLGSGALVDLSRFGLPFEPLVTDSLAAGVDLVTFSGDKLLGGPQAGILLGQRGSIDSMKKNPLLRALRIDKLSLAALEATLRLYLNPERLSQSLPVLKTLAQDEEHLSEKAARLQRSLSEIAGLEVLIEAGVGYAGGGSLPGLTLPTKLVLTRPKSVSVTQLAQHLRRRRLPIVGRIADDRFIMDVRTIAEDDISEIETAFHEALR